MRYWRRRLAEDLDLQRAATWYDIEHALFERIAAAKDAGNRLAQAQRDRTEMQAFLTQCALYWWEAGRAGEDGPS